MSASTPATAILLAVGFIFVVYFIARFIYMPPRKKRYIFSEKNFLYLVGLALFGFGLYVCPIGTMEFFQITRDKFSLSFMDNYLLWVGISGALIIVGVLLMLLKRSPRYVKKVIEEKT